MLDSSRYQNDASAIGGDAAERSLADDIKALVSDGRLLAEAELDYHKKRAIYGARQGRTIAALFVGAGVMVFFAAMGLVFGLILALGVYLTFWGSTALVVGALLIFALVLASRAKAKLRRVKAVLSEDEDAA